MLLSELTPNLILDAIESTGLYCDGSLLTLNSYENRVYRLGIHDAPPLIAKFYRPARWSDEAILEEHTFLAELATQEIPVVPALSIDQQTLFHFQDYRLALFPCQGGRAPELDSPETLQWMGRFIGRIHAISQIKSFQQRPTLDIDSFGHQSRDYLLQHNFIPDLLLAPYQLVLQQALEGVQHCYQQAGDISHIRLHGDCHLGNVLWTDAGPHFVDFDDSRMGPAIQDIWMLLSGERQEQNRQLIEILIGYEDFCEFDNRELHLIEALRTLRLIHYTAWLARRWDDPAFKQAFPWFNTEQYWQQHIGELQEQVLIMHTAPLIY